MKKRKKGKERMKGSKGNENVYALFRSRATKKMRTSPKIIVLCFSFPYLGLLQWQSPSSFRESGSWKHI